MRLDLPVTVFVKSLYSIHSNYLESLQASNKFKYLIFDTMVENIADKEKSFRKKSSKPTRRSLCFVQKAKNHPKNPSKGDRIKRGWGRRNFKCIRGIKNSRKKSYRKCKRCGKNGHEAYQCWASWESIKGRHKQNKQDKNKNQEASKAPNYSHCVVAHCNIVINEINSLSCYKGWLLVNTKKCSPSSPWSKPCTYIIFPPYFPYFWPSQLYFHKKHHYSFPQMKGWWAFIMVYPHSLPKKVKKP